MSQNDSPVKKKSQGVGKEGVIKGDLWACYLDASQALPDANSRVFNKRGENGATRRGKAWQVLNNVMFLLHFSLLF